MHIFFKNNKHPPLQLKLHSDISEQDKIVFVNEFINNIAAANDFNESDYDVYDKKTNTLLQKGKIDPNLSEIIISLKK
jgi:hypothetical protein